jgi:tetratricopeptide (TPR) repeat protein
MPSRLFFGTDERADHYIRIPRPDFTIGTGSPNACNSCHSDRDAEWAVAELLNWYGKSFFRGGERNRAFHAAWTGRDDARMLLAGIIKDSSINAITRASALIAYPYRYGSDLEELINLNREDDNPLIRYAAAITISKTGSIKSYETAFPLISDSLAAVRFKALKAVSRLNIEELPRQVRMGHSNAMNEYINLLVANGDLPENMVQLGDYYTAMQDYDKAIALYKKALLVDPANLTVLSKLSEIYKNLGMEKEYQDLNDRLRKLITRS